MKQIKYLFSANENKQLPAVGRYVFLKAAAGEILVKTDKDESAFMVQGDFIRTDRQFNRLDLEDLSGAANQITLVTADEGDAGKYGNVQIERPGSIVSTADVATVAGAATQILAANGDRAEAILVPMADARIGDANITATRGIPVSAGAAITLQTSGAIYARTVGVSSVAVIEIEY